jgi:hypothetical protein
VCYTHRGGVGQDPGVVESIGREPRQHLVRRTLHTQRTHKHLSTGTRGKGQLTACDRRPVEVCGSEKLKTSAEPRSCPPVGLWWLHEEVKAVVATKASLPCLPRATPALASRTRARGEGKVALGAGVDDWGTAGAGGEKGTAADMTQRVSDSPLGEHSRRSDYGPEVPEPVAISPRSAGMAWLDSPALVVVEGGGGGITTTGAGAGAAMIRTVTIIRPARQNHPEIAAVVGGARVRSTRITPAAVAGCREVCVVVEAGRLTGRRSDNILGLDGLRGGGRGRGGRWTKHKGSQSQRVGPQAFGSLHHWIIYHHVYAG